MIGSYYVGQRPAAPLSIEIVDNDGVAVNLSTYNNFEMVMLDPQNKRVDLTGSILGTAPGVGRLYYRLPENRSVFDKPGEYVMQLRLGNETSLDYTSEYTIRIKALGGKN